MDSCNYSAQFKHQVLVKIIEAFLSGNFTENVNRIPIDIRPKHSEPIRCCIYKERAVAAERCLSAMGFPIEETDEAMPLSHYAKQALNREQLHKKVLTIIDVACKGCVPARYYVTELCQGCLDRPCTQCPFGAITVKDGRSHIDETKCKNCGKCAMSCPYHAIIKRVVPCEDACPVGAIHKNEFGVAEIDFDKCIACGRCMRACSFGAVSGVSQVIDVLKAIQNGKKVVAMLAPAVMGQFGEMSVGKILSAVKKIGFADVMEVAHGADTTTRNEAAELAERLEKGAPFMTTSCCPAYFNFAEKHLPEIKEFISSTRTPMHYAAEMVKKRDADAVTVFVGPCSAKRDEGLRDEYTDFVLTIKEVFAILEAMQIDMSAGEEMVTDAPSKQGRGFPMTGGVAGAVASLAKCAVCPMTIDGLTKDNVKKLKEFAKKRTADGANLLEVMACTGGCVGGPVNLTDAKKSAREIKKLMEQSADLKEESK